MEVSSNSILSDKNVVEFTTVAVEFSLFLEKATSHSRQDFVAVALKLLPLLYLKATLLPHYEMEEDMELENNVTEDDYLMIRQQVAAVLGSQDDYLDVFVQDMKYSDKPILRTISEDLADIYQDIRNFTEVFRQGFDDTMRESVAAVQQNFEMYWGQSLVNTMRALHDVYYNQHIGEED